MRHGADVILMRMGDDQRQKLIPPLGDERRVGHHDLGLGILIPPEADPTIHCQPFAVASV